MYTKTTCSISKPIVPKRYVWKGLIPYVNPWCYLIGSCGLDKNVLHFYYPLKDLLDEIDMLTATLGAHRSTETAKHLLDVINMTSDEKLQFLSFARTAMSRVYEAIVRYTKHLPPMTYLFDEGHPTVSIDMTSNELVSFSKNQWVEIINDSEIGGLYIALDDGTNKDLSILDRQDVDFRHSIHYIIQWGRNLNPNVIPAIDQCIFDALKYYIIYEWLHLAYPSEAEDFLVRYNETMKLLKRYLGRLILVVVDRIPRVF